jgi:hypothetical protein
MVEQESTNLKVEVPNDTILQEEDSIKDPKDIKEEIDFDAMELGE